MEAALLHNRNKIESREEHDWNTFTISAEEEISAEIIRESLLSLWLVNDKKKKKSKRERKGESTFDR